MTLAATLSGVFAGKSQPMPGDGRPTSIFKQAVEGPVQVTSEGLDMDTQSDRRVHGGPEKAVHQFAIENYGLLASHLPELAARLIPGAIGENLSSATLHERNVQIGDVFEVGSCLLQVAQPRTPCWKIDAKFETEGITKRVAHFGIAGWYYRVLREGQLQVGDSIRLLDRVADAPTLEAFHQLNQSHRPDPAELERVAAMEALNPDWRKRMLGRAAYLRKASNSAFRRG